MAETLLAFAPGAFTHGAPDMATVPSRGAMYLDLPTRGDKHARQRERARRRIVLCIRALLDEDRGRPVPKISLPYLRCLVEPLQSDWEGMPADKFNGWSRWKRGRPALQRREHINA